MEINEKSSHKPIIWERKNYIINSKKHSSRRSTSAPEGLSIEGAEFHVPTMCIVCRPLAQHSHTSHAKGPHARFLHSQCSVGARGERTHIFYVSLSFTFFSLLYTQCVSENVWMCSVAFIKKKKEISKCYTRELFKGLLYFVEVKKKGGKILLENTWLVGRGR